MQLKTHEAHIERMEVLLYCQPNLFTQFAIPLFGNGSVPWKTFSTTSIIIEAEELRLEINLLMTISYIS
jgi:hypothetical protein